MIKVDQSEEFRRSGMVLITDPRADYYLKNRNNTKKEEKKVNHLEMFQFHWYIKYSRTLKKNLLSFMANISKKFVDINPSFQKHPITGDITLLKNEDAIKQSVKNIVMTMRGEKIFRPFFGTEVQSAIFENFNPILADDITVSIEDVLKVYEPRVKVVNVDYIDNIDDNSLEVTINYSIVGLPLNQQSLNLILERV
mgnify:CR=1 FL=1